MKLPLEGRWIALVAVIALAFSGALIVAVRFVSLPTPAPTVQQPALRTGGIGIASSNGEANSALLKEQALLDPDPLFLPTEFNASQPHLPALIRREPGASFQPVSAKYTYTLAEARIGFPEVVTVPDQPVEALLYGYVQNPYPVFGRFSRQEAPLPPRQVFLEVVHAKTGRQIFSSSLTIADAPVPLTTADWRPLELLAAVDATGLIGLPVLSRGSGVESVDTFLRSYLAKQFHLGERLPPGFYALRVGP